MGIVLGIALLISFLVLLFLFILRPVFADVKAGNIYAKRTNQSLLQRAKSLFDIFETYEVNGQLINDRDFLRLVPRGNCMEYAGIPEGTKVFAREISDVSNYKISDAGDYYIFPDGREIRKGDVVVYNIADEKNALWERKLRRVIKPHMLDGKMGIKSQKCEDGRLKESWHPLSELIGVVEYVAE